MKRLSLLLVLLFPLWVLPAELLVIDISYLKPGYCLVVQGETVTEVKLLTPGKTAPLPTGLGQRVQDYAKSHKKTAVKALGLIYKRFSEEVASGKVKPMDVLGKVKEATDSALPALGDDLLVLRRGLSEEFSRLLAEGKFSAKADVATALKAVSEALASASNN